MADEELKKVEESLFEYEVVELPLKKEIWGYTADDYIQAFTLAHHNYNATFNRQRWWNGQKEELTTEFLIVATTIVTGSFMVASFGSASLGVLAENAALKIICDNNLERTFAGLYWLRTNPTATFALGAIKDEASKKIKDSVTRAVRNHLTGMDIKVDSMGDPLVEAKKLEAFLKRSFVCTSEFAADVRKNKSLGSEDKRKILEQLQKVPIFNPPHKSININELRDRIELSFYMALLLDSDYLRDYAGKTTRPFREKPITAMPGSSAYPPPVRYYPQPPPRSVLDLKPRAPAGTVVGGDTGLGFYSRVEIDPRAGN